MAASCAEPTLREIFLSASKPTIAVLATLDTKGREARFVAEVLARAGATPWIVDLSLKSHKVDGADVAGAGVAAAAGTSWQALSERSRQDAAAVMAEGGKKILLDGFINGEISGVIGLGGANGTNLVCSIMRALPYLVPKVMVSAALAVAAAARNWTAKREANTKHAPLVAVSSFGGTAGCVDRVSKRLEDLGYEVIQFHASGVGGKSLERLAALGELAGVVDVTTHELTDLIVDGVYSAGDARLTGAGAAGLPQVVVPGAIDHANLWVGQVPERYKAREFLL